MNLEDLPYSCKWRKTLHLQETPYTYHDVKCLLLILPCPRPLISVVGPQHGALSYTKKSCSCFSFVFLKVIVGQNFVSSFEIVPREYYTYKALLSRE